MFWPIMISMFYIELLISIIFFVDVISIIIGTINVIVVIFLFKVLFLGSVSNVLKKEKK